jgi:anti-anti-sigma factor
MSATLALIEDDLDHHERVVALRGELDVDTTPALREWLARASEGGTRSIAVDLTHVSFLAVSGLHVLVDEQHRMAAHRARLTIVCPHPRIVGLFELCRLDDALSIVPSRAELRGAVWTLGDDLRALRLERWLDRYERSRPA